MGSEQSSTTNIENKISNEINTTIKNTIDVVSETINKSITNTVINISNVSNVSATSNLTVDIEFGLIKGEFVLSGIKLDSTINVTSDMVNKAISDINFKLDLSKEINNTLSSDSVIMKKLKANLKTGLDKLTKMDQVTAGVGLTGIKIPGYSSQDINTSSISDISSKINTLINNDTKLKNIITNIVENNIKSSSINECKSSISNILNIKAKANIVEGSVTIQDINLKSLIELVAKCLNISNTGNKFINEIVSKEKSDVKQKTKEDIKTETKSETKIKLKQILGGRSIVEMIIGGIVIIFVIFLIYKFYKLKISTGSDIISLVTKSTELVDNIPISSRNIENIPKSSKYINNLMENIPKSSKNINNLIENISKLKK